MLHLKIKHTTSKDFINLIYVLEKESNEVVQWFRDNEIVANPDKFQMMIANSDKRMLLVPE